MKRNDAVIGSLKKYFEANASELRVDLAFLYGSWAAGLERKDSDVDIAVLFAEDAGSEGDRYGAISEMSADLGADLRREVNVIELRRDFDKPMLYYNAVVHGVALHVKSRELHDSFFREAVAQMEDFCIFGVAWQLAAARRNLKGVPHG